MTHIKRVRKAFSLIEVIFVLVILGIVASIGSSIIVQVYDSYITQNALYKVTTKTELVANQIVNRLTYAIPTSTISKVTNTNGVWNGNTTEDDGWIQLKNIMLGTSAFKTIEWIGSDNDSFSAAATPGWSGVANYNSSTINILNTPGSNLTLSRDIIFNLSNSEVDMNTNDLDSAAVIFREKNNYYTDTIITPQGEYNPSCMGLITNDNSCIFPVRRLNNNTLTFLKVGEAKIITERYKLAWSAYAIVPEDPDGDGLWDLYLYSNYQPWNNGETYNNKIYNSQGYSPEGISRKLLMRNVSVFKFTKNGGIIQFKLCASSKISATQNISTCKEKVVLR